MVSHLRKAGSFSSDIKKAEKSPLPRLKKTVKGKFVYTIVFYVYNARCENVNKVLKVNKFWSHPITGTPIFGIFQIKEGIWQQIKKTVRMFLSRI